MKCTRYVGVCVQSSAVRMTYTSQSFTLLQTVPSLHSRTRSLFAVVQDSDSSRSGIVVYWQSNGQTGKWVGAFLSPRGGASFCVGFVCGHVTRYMFHYQECVPRMTLPTCHVQPRQMLPVFIGILFSLLLVFSPQQHNSHSTPQGAQKTRQSVWKKAGRIVRVINKKDPLINDSYFVLSPWRRLRQRG